jgi:hypothetical protein
MSREIFCEGVKVPIDKLSMEGLGAKERASVALSLRFYAA